MNPLAHINVKWLIENIYTVWSDCVCVRACLRGVEVWWRCVWKLIDTSEPTADASSTLATHRRFSIT